MDSPDEFVGRAGWNLLIARNLKRDTAGLSLDAILKRIEAEILSAPYRKQESMNRCLVEIGCRVPVLLTTHSVELLDNPTIRPANIRVVQMIDGRTVIAPVDEASVEIVTRKLNTLGGLERDNLLEPDIDDMDRQNRLGQTPEEAPA